VSTADRSNATTRRRRWRLIKEYERKPLEERDCVGKEASGSGNRCDTCQMCTVARRFRAEFNISRRSDCRPTNLASVCSFFSSARLTHLRTVTLQQLLRAAVRRRQAAIFLAVFFHGDIYGPGLTDRVWPAGVMVKALGLQLKEVASSAPGRSTTTLASCSHTIMCFCQRAIISVAVASSM